MNPSPAGLVLAVWIAGAGLGSAAGALCARADGCSSTVVGLDTSQAEPDTVSTLGLRCGEAGGETFPASDTLIRSIYVWRHHAQTPYGGSLKLWITEVDAAGVPDLSQVILEGLVITVPFGDGIHPIKMEWNFDPPFALPYKGNFYFAVQDYCGGHWSLLVNDSNAFAGGSAWRSGISCLDGCYLRQFPDQFVSSDLIFTIVFCGDVATAARPQSWGRLKILYR